MRAAWPIFVGIALVGCKDSQPSKPAEQHSPPAPTSGAGSAATKSDSPALTGSAAISAPPMPRLDPAEAKAAFDAEAEDKEWAASTERAIKSAMPDLADIDCKQQQCRATLNASSEADLVKKAERLSDGQALKGTNAKRVMLTAPTDENGKQSMTIYVVYDR